MLDPQIKSSLHARPTSTNISLYGPQEWSQGEFKCFSGEIIMEPTSQGTRAASYSLKLECSSSTINQSFDKNLKTISLLDQILVAFIIIFLYIVFLHALSQSAQT